MWEQICAIKSPKWNFWVRQKDRDKHILLYIWPRRRQLVYLSLTFLFVKRRVGLGVLQVLSTLRVPEIQKLPTGRSLAMKMPLALVICPQTQCPWVQATRASGEPNFILCTANRAELEDTSPKVRPDFICPQMMSVFCSDLLQVAASVGILLQFTKLKGMKGLNILKINGREH